MALVACSECGSEVSDRAAACPKCGNPLSVATTQTAAVAAAPAQASAHPSANWTLPRDDSVDSGVGAASASGGVGPGGIVLGAGESVASTASFRFSVVLFFLSTSFVLTTRRLAGEEPNTWFGLIPVGSRKFSYPLGNISAVGINTRVSWKKLLLGAVLVLLGLAWLGSSFLWGLVVLLIGIWVLISAFRTYIEVVSPGGNRGLGEARQISVFPKDAAQNFVNQINTAIASRP